MTKAHLSVIKRIKQQSNEEWVEAFSGNHEKYTSAVASIIDLRPEKNVTNNTFLDSLNKAGITYIGKIGDYILIKTNVIVTTKLDQKIKEQIQHIATHAKPYTDDTLYEYTGYRTFVNKGPFLAITFRELHTSKNAERYFNITLKNKKGKNFKTGENGEFRNVGNCKRLQNGMFLKLWMDSVKSVPDNRLSHIYRYMNSKLKGKVFSCSEVIHRDGIDKLTTLNYEGQLYQLPSSTCPE